MSYRSWHVRLCPVYTNHENLVKIDPVDCGIIGLQRGRQKEKLWQKFKPLPDKQKRSYHDISRTIPGGGGEVISSIHYGLTGSRRRSRSKVVVSSRRGWRRVWLVRCCAWQYHCRWRSSVVVRAPRNSTPRRNFLQPPPRSRHDPAARSHGNPPSRRLPQRRPPTCRYCCWFQLHARRPSTYKPHIINLSSPRLKRALGPIVAVPRNPYPHSILVSGSWNLENDTTNGQTGSTTVADCQRANR